MSSRIQQCIAALVMCLVLPCAVWAAPKIIENAPVGGSAQAAAPRARGVPVVWDMPQLQNRIVKLRLAMAVLFKQGKFTEAEKAAEQSISLVPHDAAAYYLLAATQGRQGKNDEALANLAKSIDLGFNKSEALQRDPSFAGLHENLRFAELIAAAAIAEPEPNPWRRHISPATVEGKEALVSAANTAWDAQHGVFISMFKTPTGDAAASHGPSSVADRINEWYREGTAAGNYGDYYDNHDGHHSFPRMGFFPQLTEIKFDEEVKRRQFHSGLQTRFFYNGIVFGNSSTALVNGPYWRSQPRLAYVDKRSAALLYLQYTKNHLYVYPEHKDHDVELGDVYPANTPYVIITQGSSFTDKPVLEAIGYILAAFRPEVKEFLAKNGALMPTVQLIFRLSQNEVRKPEDYFTAKAHPTVFNSRFSPERMVTSAHQITKDETPPLVRLKVVEDDPSVVGRDFFDAGNRQELFTTPCAIARVHRTTNQNYQMVVSAEDSTDLNGRDLTYHWKLLRGDADKISIKPISADGAIVEIKVGWQPTQPIAPESEMKSNRVDIACFVKNGLYFSAPAFVTFFTLANESRSYRDDGQIEWVQYKTPGNGGAYVDPIIDAPKDWRDTYHYDDGKLTGWTREKDGASQQFTADGAIVLTRDENGRAKLAQTVDYAADRAAPQSPPTLRQSQRKEWLHYEYASPDDRVGRVVKREAAP